MTAVGRFFYESLTLNSAGNFFTDRRSGSDRCAEETVIRGSTVAQFNLDVSHTILIQTKVFGKKSQKTAVTNFFDEKINMLLLYMIKT